MAIIFIKDIQSRLDKALSYVGNKSKTENEKFFGVQQELHKALEYSVDDLKTEQQFYVSGINTEPSEAFTQMCETKRLFNKPGGILGFHIIQSFAPGEGTPETVHEIGCEFARRMFGDRFEALVATHKNTDCLHNHIILNSTSFIDGRKYYDNKESYAYMRTVSDALCEEYGFSVIMNPKQSSRKNYKEYMAEKNDEWTKDAIIRRDIDECIAAETSPKGFYRAMEKRGYKFDFSHKYATVIHCNFPRARRLKTLGEDYTPERIEERVLASWEKQNAVLPTPENLIQEYLTDIKDDSFRNVYVRFLTVVKIIKQNPDKNRELSYFLAEEIQKLDRLIEQQNLLCGNNIDTAEQLNEFKDSLVTEIKEVDDARHKLHLMLRAEKGKGRTAEAEAHKDSIKLLTERMRILRRDIRTCERISQQEPTIEAIAASAAENERKGMIIHEQRRRRSGTNRQNEPARGGSGS